MSKIDFRLGEPVKVQVELSRLELSILDGWARDSGTSISAEIAWAIYDRVLYSDDNAFWQEIMTDRRRFMSERGFAMNGWEAVCRAIGAARS